MFSYTEFEMLQNLETIIKTKESKGEKWGRKRARENRLTAREQRITQSVPKGNPLTADVKSK